MCMVVVIVTIVVQSHAVELFKWIRDFAHRGSETRVQWNALDFRYANVDALALFDVSEVGCLNTMALVRNNGRLRVAEQRPLCGTEEWCGLDVRGTSARSKASSLVLDKKLADERLAKTISVSVM